MKYIFWVEIYIYVKTETCSYHIDYFVSQMDTYCTSRLSLFTFFIYWLTFELRTKGQSCRECS